MRIRTVSVALALSALAVTGAGAAPPPMPPTYRFVDEQGNVHYVARRDQVPERYRSQLAPPRPGEPARPQLIPNATGPAGAPTGCILRLRGDERRVGSSHSYADCDACRKALHALGRTEGRRAECFASSIEDELGKRGR